MDLRNRLGLLIPDALLASRKNVTFEVVPPILPRIWQEIPKDEPLQVRCALAEREILRRIPLAVSGGELLAGRIDSSTSPADDHLDPSLRPFPGGQTAHTALDATKLLSLGICGIEREIRERMGACDGASRDFYRSTLISLEGFRELAARLREMADERSAKLTGPAASEMRRLADVLTRVPEEPARTFYEAIQALHLLYFAATVTVQSLYGPGRMDRYLLPYYLADLKEGRITRDQALELICCQFILMNHLFSLPQPVMVGGTGPDGRDTTNELTYLCLEADRLVGLVNPAIAVAVNEETPGDLLDSAAEMLLSGRTKPALFGDRTVLEGLEQRGVPLEDASWFVHSTCVEITISGKSNIMVASPYVNLVKPLEYMLNDGEPIVGEKNAWDLNSHTRIEPPNLEAYNTFEDFLDQYMCQLSDRIADAAERMRDIRRRRVEGWAYPLVSCFTDDCIARGLDMDRGGARYTWTETSCVGLANLVDSLMTVKHKVFDQRRFSLKDIRGMLLEDFPNELKRRELTVNIPRYGNDQGEPDELAGRIVQAIYREHAKYRDFTGGHFVPGFFCWVMHRILGGSTAATPDGRRAGEVLADGAGAAQGRDSNGPTAAVRSITSWDHTPGLGGIVLNLRFSPKSFPGKDERARLVDLIKVYFRLGGFEVQVNAVDTETLKDAQDNPENHRSLLVRVAGYSDYFTNLDPMMQEEIIRRTEHEWVHPIK